MTDDSSGIWYGKLFFSFQNSYKMLHNIMSTTLMVMPTHNGADYCPPIEDELVGFH